MAFLFHKFQEAVKILAKDPVFAKNPILAKIPVLSRGPRQLQFESDINRLFLYTSYNLLGKNADEADAEEIIEMANKATVAVQQMQVQENVHSQIKAFCTFMDEVLLPNEKVVNVPLEFSQQENSSPHHGGLSVALSSSDPPTNNPGVLKRRSLSLAEISLKLRDQLGYTLNVKPSQISHKDAGQGLYLDGEVDVGAVVAFYPGVVYSPAYYQYIPGYLNEQNPYLITRYDGTVIDAQPWGSGGDEQELWDGKKLVENKPDMQGVETTSNNQNKSVGGSQVDNSDSDEVLERRNPLALAHFANHPVKGVLPNVMVCPYDFPLTESSMRVYIPNILFGNEVNMKGLSKFGFKSGMSRTESHVPTLKTVVLVATRDLQDEELFLNYRLSNTKQCPEWYDAVDEEDEDMKRWS